MSRGPRTPTPWEETCPGLRRAMAEAVATESLPGWVETHLNRCSRCRRGLAYVVGRSSHNLTIPEQDLQGQVAFVAKVRGLAREITLAHGDGDSERRRWYPVGRFDRAVAWVNRDWRVPSVAALLLAMASAAMAIYLVATGPRVAEAHASTENPQKAPAGRLVSPEDSIPFHLEEPGE